MPGVAELGVCAETQGRFQSHPVKSLLKQGGSGKTRLFLGTMTFHSSKESWA